VTANKRTIQFDLAVAGNVVPSIEYCVDQINTTASLRPAIFPIPRGSRRRRKPRPSPTTSLRKSQPDTRFLQISRKNPRFIVISAVFQPQN
jgi:hypothetical protein